MVNRPSKVVLFTTGFSNSTPKSDQVPLEIYALPADERGVAKTADAVSWLAVAKQVSGPIPVFS